MANHIRRSGNAWVADFNVNGRRKQLKRRTKAEARDAMALCLTEVETKKPAKDGDAERGQAADDPDQMAGAAVLESQQPDKRGGAGLLRGCLSGSNHVRKSEAVAALPAGQGEQARDSEPQGVMSERDPRQRGRVRPAPRDAGDAKAAANGQRERPGFLGRGGAGVLSDVPAAGLPRVRGPADVLD